MENICQGNVLSKLNVYIYFCSAIRLGLIIIQSSFDLKVHGIKIIL